MRQLLIFAGLFVIASAVLAGYAERQIESPPARATTAMAVAPATEVQRNPGRTVVIPRDSRGHFQVNGRVDGKSMGFMVDTGASVIALTARDAARIGLRPMLRDF